VNQHCVTVYRKSLGIEVAPGNSYAVDNVMRNRLSGHLQRKRNVFFSKR